MKEGDLFPETEDGHVFHSAGKLDNAMNARKRDEKLAIQTWSACGIREPPDKMDTEFKVFICCEKGQFSMAVAKHAHDSARVTDNAKELEKGFLTDKLKQSFIAEESWRKDWDKKVIEWILITGASNEAIIMFVRHFFSNALKPLVAAVDKLGEKHKETRLVSKLSTSKTGQYYWPGNLSGNKSTDNREVHGTKIVIMSNFSNHS